MRQAIMSPVWSNFDVKNPVDTVPCPVGRRRLSNGVHALNFERMERKRIRNSQCIGKLFFKVCLKPFARDFHIYSMKRYLGLLSSSKSSVFSARPRVASFSHNCLAGGSLKRLE